MKFSLGIDARGTYTDAVLVRDTDGPIMATSKALTTYPDLIRGIHDAIDGLRTDDLDKVSLFLSQPHLQLIGCSKERGVR